METWKHQRTVSQRSVALAVSAALHVGLLLAVLWPAAVRSNVRIVDTGIQARLIGEAGELKTKADAPTEHASERLADRGLSKDALSECDGRTYTGIGLRTWANGTILEVAVGGPADKAGLRAGDTLLNADATAPDEHQPGTVITLRYLRHELEMPPVVARIEKICNEQPRPPAREPGTV